MVLSDKDLNLLIKKGLLKIEPLEYEVKEEHVHLRLAATILKYKSKVVDLKKESSFEARQIIIGKDGYKLKPKEFILGSTLEKVSIPNGYWGLLETKGNIARAGIQTCNTDGHIGPGFKGNIVLEITNNSNQSIIIYPGLDFVQLYIFKMTSPCLNTYSGIYQNQKGITIFKKDKSTLRRN